MVPAGRDGRAGRVAGARACPPEHEEQTLWVEDVYGAAGLDPEAFDADAVGRLLRIAATGEPGADDRALFDR